MAVVSVVTLCLHTAPAKADLFGFTPLTGNSDGSVARQLSLEVSPGGGVASFTFYNNLAPGLVASPAVASSITQVYFDDQTAPRLLANLVGIDDPAGVSLKKVGSGNLPGGKSLLDDFTFDFGAQATKAGGVRHNGVQPGEYVTLKFSTPPTVSLAEIVAALNAGAGNVSNATGTLRIGIHVQGIGAYDYSDTFVLEPLSHTPAPGALLLGMLGMGTASLKLRRLTR